jgi:excisionase family DNA binding protein
MMVVDEQYYTLEEVADRLKVSPRSVKRWVADGKLPVIRLSAQKGSVRVADGDLRIFLDERRSKPRDPRHTLKED